MSDIPEISFRLFSFPVGERLLSTLLLRLRLYDEYGYGLVWAFSERKVRAIALLAQDLASVLGMRRFERVEDAWLAMYRTMPGLGREGASMAALSVVDMAVQMAISGHGASHKDGLGQKAQHPVAAYAGGILAEADVGQVLRQVEYYLEAGLRAVKLSVGVTSPSHDATCVAHVRRVCGDDVDLMLDAVGRFETRDAVEFIQRVAPYSITWFEDPVDQDDCEGFKAVRRVSPIRLAGGQFCSSPQSLSAYLEKFPIDVAIVDVARIGGPTAWKMIERTLPSSVRLLSGLALPQIHGPLLAESHHETIVECMTWWDSLLGPICVVDGKVPASSSGAWEIPWEEAWSRAGAM